MNVAPVVLADVVEGDDVRMVEGGGRPCFLNEAAPPFGVGHDLGPQELDGDRPPQARVAGGVDHAHAAPANLGVDAIVGNLVWH